MLRDKKRFMRLADPLLGRRYPVKGLYQALAVASLCLQEDAASRPGISDVVAALSFLADLKLGHYMKIPPRCMYTAQVSIDP